MNHVSVSRSALVLAILTTAVLSTACEDKRVRELDTGITRDSAVQVISQDLKPGSPSDSFPNVYRRDLYLMGGKHYEVMFFTPHNEKQGKDSVKLKNLTPIVFMENKLIGRGWPFWDSVAKANKIPIQPR
jgi:hypothetical protein